MKPNHLNKITRIVMTGLFYQCYPEHPLIRVILFKPFLSESEFAEFEN